MKSTLSKIICIILAMILFAVMALGTGSSNSETPSSNDSSSDGTTPDNSDNGSKSTAYSIQDEVIFDNENCTFKITKAEKDSVWGVVLKAYCENKTADTTLMFSLENVGVNGYMVDPFWAEEVAPGKKSNEEITFSKTAFKEIGIDTADEITFTLRIYDSENWSADEIVEDSFTIYPTGLKSESVVYPERKTSQTEQVVIDDDNVCFVILDSREDKIWGYTLDCYIENKTDASLMFSWDDVSVNGYMVDPFWAKEVAPGMRSYSSIDFSKTGFEDNNITSVEEIEYTMRIYDALDWGAKDVYNKTFTYNP